MVVVGANIYALSGVEKAAAQAAFTENKKGSGVRKGRGWRKTGTYCSKQVSHTGLNELLAIFYHNAILSLHLKIGICNCCRCFFHTVIYIIK